MKTVLITGVAGLIGSRVADYIIQNNPLNEETSIIGIDSLFGGYTENINERVIFFKRDLSKDDISDIFRNYHPDYVYHFAAYAAEGLSPFIRHFNYDNNIGSTVNIINNCINFDVKRLVYTSSMSVYGHGISSGRIFNEDDPCIPIDPYGISKYACEMDIRVAGEQHGLDWVIIRPHNVFGVKQNIWDKYRNVLGIWINNIINNRPMLVYGDGLQQRAFTYIDNILPCMCKAMVSDKCSKQIINLGGIRGYTLNSMAELLGKICGNSKIEHREQRHEVKIAIPDYNKSIEYLDYKETYDIEYGLREMYTWALTQPRREQFKWPSYEINKGLYSYWK